MSSSQQIDFQHHPSICFNKDCACTALHALAERWLNTPDLQDFYPFDENAEKTRLFLDVGTVPEKPPAIVAVSEGVPNPICHSDGTSGLWTVRLQIYGETPCVVTGLGDLIYSCFEGQCLHGCTFGVCCLQRVQIPIPRKQSKFRFRGDLGFRGTWQQKKLCVKT